MDFKEQYTDSLIKCFEADDLVLAGKLIRNFHKIGMEPDTVCLYLEAAYHYYSGRYALSLFYCDMCVIKYPEYEPVWELIGYITEFKGDRADYVPTFKYDVSSYHKPLNILGFKGYMAIVDYTVDLMKRIFEELGHNVEIIDIKDNSNPPIDSSFFNHTDLIYEFNNMGPVYRGVSGEDITVSRNIPVYSYMFDSPLFFADVFNDYPPNRTAVVPDRNHEKYIRRFYKNVKDVFFVPLGSEEKPGSDIPFKDRTIGCIYLGSLKDAPSHLEDEFSRRLFEFQKTHTSLTTEESIEQYYGSLSEEDYRNLFPDIAKGNPTKRCDEEFLLRLNAHYCFCDLKINSYFRKRLVEVLVENGIDVEVYGNGWDDEKLLTNPHFKYGGLISQDECIEKMKDSKFILNSMPWFKDGTHDRIYNAMLAKGLCVTDKSGYLCEEFTDGRDIVFYDLDDMDKLPDIIRHYEANPDKANQIITAAYDKTVLKHSWVNRGIDILTHLLYEK